MLGVGVEVGLDTKENIHLQVHDYVVEMTTHEITEKRHALLHDQDIRINNQ